MKIQNVADASFRKYGKVLEGYDFSALLKEMKHTPVPDDVVYVPSVEELEALDVAKELQNKGFGGIPIEIGYCNGHNKKLNAVEYHRSSEINVAVTDLVLLIGSQQDITDELTYDTSKIEAFLVPAGTGIEVRSEEHTSELQSPSIISYAVFCLKKNFFNDTATTEIYTLSLHDALPISADAVQTDRNRPAHHYRTEPAVWRDGP